MGSSLPSGQARSRHNEAERQRDDPKGSTLVAKICTSQPTRYHHERLRSSEWVARMDPLELVL